MEWKGQRGRVATGLARSPGGHYIRASPGARRSGFKLDNEEILVGHLQVLRQGGDLNLDL
jgi:hypothetical protein